MSEERGAGKRWHERVRDSFAGNVEGGTVDGLEHCKGERRRGGKPSATGDASKRREERTYWKGSLGRGRGWQWERHLGERREEKGGKKRGGKGRMGQLVTPQKREGDRRELTD